MTSSYEHWRPMEEDTLNDVEVQMAEEKEVMEMEEALKDEIPTLDDDETYSPFFDDQEDDEWWGF